MDYTLNDSSLKSSTRYLWDKLLIKKILKTLNDFKDEEKTSKRNFTLFLIELKMAYDEFLGSVKDLPMTMILNLEVSNARDLQIHFARLAINI